MNITPYTAPAFKLQDADGTWHSLGEYRGTWLVLFFYPKDFTPGCTTEVCNLRDQRDDIIEQTGAQILGISRDDSASHTDFSKEHRLTFPLLSDPDAAVVRLYGCEGSTIYDGKNEVLRKTFLIDPEGVIQKVYEAVTPDAHGQEILADLLALQRVS